VSKNYVKAVLDCLPGLTNPTDAAVLVAIAEYTSDETRLAWPSIASLMRRTRYCERVVRYALRRLEKQRLISTTIGGQDDRGRNMASVFRVEFDHRGEPLEAKASPKRALQSAQTTPAKPPQSATPVSHEESKAALERIYGRIGRRPQPK